MLKSGSALTVKHHQLGEVSGLIGRLFVVRKIGFLGLGYRMSDSSKISGRTSGLMVP